MSNNNDLTFTEVANLAITGYLNANLDKDRYRIRIITNVHSFLLLAICKDEINVGRDTLTHCLDTVEQYLSANGMIVGSIPI